MCAVAHTAVIKIEGGKVNLVNYTNLASCTNTIIVASNPTIMDPDKRGPTDDRKSKDPSLGVTCFDCHVNGHTNAATHLVGDIRPHRVHDPFLWLLSRFGTISSGRG